MGEESDSRLERDLREILVPRQQALLGGGTAGAAEGARLIRVEGVGGAGKSVLLAEYRDALRAQGVDTLLLCLDEEYVRHRDGSLWDRVIADAVDAGCRQAGKASWRSRALAFVRRRRGLEAELAIVGEFQRAYAPEGDRKPRPPWWLLLVLLVLLVMPLKLASDLLVQRLWGSTLWTWVGASFLGVMLLEVVINLMPKVRHGLTVFTIRWRCRRLLKTHGDGARLADDQELRDARGRVSRQALGDECIRLLGACLRRHADRNKRRVTVLIDAQYVEEPGEIARVKRVAQTFAGMLGAGNCGDVVVATRPVSRESIDKVVRVQVPAFRKDEVEAFAGLVDAKLSAADDGLKLGEDERGWIRSGGLRAAEQHYPIDLYYRALVVAKHRGAGPGVWLKQVSDRRRSALEGRIVSKSEDGFKGAGKREWAAIETLSLGGWFNRSVFERIYQDDLGTGWQDFGSRLKHETWTRQVLQGGNADVSGHFIEPGARQALKLRIPRQDGSGRDVLGGRLKQLKQMLDAELTEASAPDTPGQGADAVAAIPGLLYVGLNLYLMHCIRAPDTQTLTAQEVDGTRPWPEVLELLCGLADTVRGHPDGLSGLEAFATYVVAGLDGVLAQLDGGRNVPGWQRRVRAGLEAWRSLLAGTGADQAGTGASAPGLAALREREHTLRGMRGDAWETGKQWRIACEVLVRELRKVDEETAVQEADALESRLSAWFEQEEQRLRGVRDRSREDGDRWRKHVASLAGRCWWQALRHHPGEAGPESDALTDELVSWLLCGAVRESRVRGGAALLVPERASATPERIANALRARLWQAERYRAAGLVWRFPQADLERIGRYAPALFRDASDEDLRRFCMRMAKLLPGLAGAAPEAVTCVARMMHALEHGDRARMPPGVGTSYGWLWLRLEAGIRMTIAVLGETGGGHPDASVDALIEWSCDTAWLGDAFEPDDISPWQRALYWQARRAAHLREMWQALGDDGKVSDLWRFNKALSGCLRGNEALGGQDDLRWLDRVAASLAERSGHASTRLSRLVALATAPDEGLLADPATPAGCETLARLQARLFECCKLWRDINDERQYGLLFDVSAGVYRAGVTALAIAREQQAGGRFDGSSPEGGQVLALLDGIHACCVDLACCRYRRGYAGHDRVAEKIAVWPAADARGELRGPQGLFNDILDAVAAVEWTQAPEPGALVVVQCDDPANARQGGCSLAGRPEQGVDFSESDESGLLPPVLGTLFIGRKVEGTTLADWKGRRFPAAVRSRKGGKLKVTSKSADKNDALFVRQVLDVFLPVACVPAQRVSLAGGKTAERLYENPEWPDAQVPADIGLFGSNAILAWRTGDRIKSGLLAGGGQVVEALRDLLGLRRVTLYEAAHPDRRGSKPLDDGAGIGNLRDWVDAYQSRLLVNDVYQELNLVSAGTGVEAVMFSAPEIGRDPRKERTFLSLHRKVIGRDAWLFHPRAWAIRQEFGVAASTLLQRIGDVHMDAVDDAVLPQLDAVDVLTDRKDAGGCTVLVHVERVDGDGEVRRVLGVFPRQFWFSWIGNTKRGEWKYMEGKETLAVFRSAQGGQPPGIEWQGRRYPVLEADQPASNGVYHVLGDPLPAAQDERRQDLAGT